MVETNEVVSTKDGLLYEVQVSADGGTVWVNGPDGSAVGRFAKRFGLDVHRSGSEQLNGLGECLFCTHYPPGRSDWAQFVAAMKEHYGLEIDPCSVRFDEANV
jgi:hypothetical protein